MCRATCSPIVSSNHCIHIEAQTPSRWNSPRVSAADLKPGDKINIVSTSPRRIPAPLAGTKKTCAVAKCRSWSLRFKFLKKVPSSKVELLRWQSDYWVTSNSSCGKKKSRNFVEVSPKNYTASVVAVSQLIADTISRCSITFRWA